MGWVFDGIERQDKERKYSDMELIKRMLKRAAPYKTQILIVILMVLLGTAVNLFAPLLFELAINQYLGVDFWGTSLGKILGSFDRVLGSNFWSSIFGAMDQFFGQFIGPLWLLWLALVGYFLCWVTIWIAEYVNQIATAWYVPDFMVDLRLDIFNAIQKQDLKFFDKIKTGRLNSRVASDASDFGGVIMIISGFLANILILATIFIVLLLIEWRLALVTMLVIPLVLIATYTFRRIARITSMSFRRSIAGVNSAMQQNVAGIKIAKSFGQETETLGEFREINQKNFVAGLRRNISMFALFPILDLISAFGLVIILYFGGQQTIFDPIGFSAGTLYIFYLYLLRFFQPLMQLSAFYSQFQAGMAGFERILEVIDAEPEVVDAEDPIDIEKEKIQGGIVFENVDFAYIPDQPVLKNFNLSIKPGEKVAIVGHTGAGKTSLIAMLSRFYEFQGGKILLDELDIRKIPLKSYRTLFGIVSQENYLFSGTINDNICYGRQCATEGDVWRALRTVNADEFIRYLPQGLETEVGERGSRLSMGQRQLICFARAILTDPKILILDEATSSVDAYTEAIIQEALEKLMEGRTSIVIAHRLTTIENADRIIVMEKGKIVEIGSHIDLLQKGGIYASLYNMYFKHQSLDWQPEKIPVAKSEVLPE
ncbi:MAG: ABC transporter ATP-binding protein [Candidatus Hermodarchaeota archaeon]